MEKKTITPLEISEMFDVSLTTVYRWIKAGKLPVVNLGRKKIISRERLEEMLNEGYNPKENE